MGTGVIAGLATGTVLLPMNIALAEGIKQRTGIAIGNTQFKEALNDYCEDQGLSEEECFEKAKQALTDNEVFITVAAPLMEEGIFRFWPSLSLSSRNPEEDPLTVALSGTGGLGMTKRELAVGIISTGIFAGMHSITKKGIEGIPIPQMIAGSAFWYLQRKFGFLANISAHIANNSIAMQMIKNISFPQT